MRDIHIEREEEAGKGRYFGRMANVDGEAELTFTRRAPHLVSADHTSAPQSMRGTGAAVALIERLISDARSEGFKIIPSCPYVQAQLKRHPEWADVMAPAAS